MTTSSWMLSSIAALLLVTPVRCFIAKPVVQAQYRSHEQHRQQSSRAYQSYIIDEGAVCVNRRTTHSNLAPPTRLQMSARAETATERKQVPIQSSKKFPRGPLGSLQLTYLEINSWLIQSNGINILLDPLFGVLDFGIPALLQAKKRVLWDSERVTKELATVTDFLAISQGFDDHCHPATLEALSRLLDPSIRIIAPPSAGGVLEKYFDKSRITYLLPGERTVLAKGGRAVEVTTTTGAVLGPPWQQAENGYIFRPTAAKAGDKVPSRGGSLYYEPHTMFKEEELSQYNVDVIISAVVQQNIGPYPLVIGGARVLELVDTLKASKLVTMANGDGDFSGPLGNVVTETNTRDEFLAMARAENVDVLLPEPGVPLNAWP